MLRGGVVSERIREQGLAAIECDIPDRWSISEYRKAMAIGESSRAPERPSPLRRLRALRR
jgi:hypothetical protein